ncbi:MAG: permease [Rhodococcus sp.]|nr:permease [Rhodococcus sp. (in: high G+C Gram-positive bacteria)]
MTTPVSESPPRSTYLFLLALGVGVILIPAYDPVLRAFPVVATFSTLFAAVFVQALPFLALGVVLSASIAAFVPAGLFERVLPKNQGVAVGIAGVSGAALPGCECGSVPVARRLLDHGVPAAVALTFLLSAPAINPVVLVATAVAFPGHPEMVLARALASLATALIVGWLWIRIGRAEWITVPAAVSCHPDAQRSRLDTFIDSARSDFLRSSSFLVIGAATAAALHLVVPASIYDGLANQILLAIVLMAALAVVLSLCSEADAFVVAALPMLPLLPRLVFLVVGPAIDIKLFAMQVGTFGRAFALRFAPLTLIVAVVCASAIGLLVFGGVG